MRILVVLASLLVMSVTAARQPVTSPIYYLSTAPRLEIGVPVVGVLTEASGRSFKDGAHLDVLTLRGQGGEYVELVASSTAFDTYLTLYAPDGTVLDANDDDPFGHGTDAAIRTTLPEAGTYVVVVSGYGPWDLGPYTVTRSGGGAGGATPVDVPSSTSAVLDPAGTPARYEFVLEESAVIGIQARSTAFDTTLEVLDEYGYSLAYNDDAPIGDVYTTDSALALVLAPGRYQVVVQPYFLDAIGDGRFELEVVRLVPEH
jgi:hypothetical protein